MKKTKSTLNRPPKKRKEYLAEPDHPTYSVVRKLGGASVVASKLAKQTGQEITVYRVALWRRRGIPWYWQTEIKKIIQGMNGKK